MTLSTIHRATIRKFSRKSSRALACANSTLEPRPDRGGLRHFLLVGAAAAVLAMAPAPAFAQHAGGHAAGGGGGHSGGGFGFGGGHSSGGFGGGHASGGSHASGASHGGVAEGGSRAGGGGNSGHAGEAGRSAANPNGGGHWWSGIFGGGHANANSERGATSASANAATGAWPRTNVNVAEAARENAAQKNAQHANAAPAGSFFENGVRLSTTSNMNSLRGRSGVSMAPAQNNSRAMRGLFPRPGGLNAAGGLAVRPAIGMAAAPRGHLHPHVFFYDPFFINPFFFSGFGNCYYGYCGAGFGPGWGWGFGFGAGYYGFGGSYWNAACDPFWGCNGYGYNGWGYDNSANYNNTANGSGDYTVDAGGQSQESNPGPYENPPADMNGDAQAGASAEGANGGASVDTDANASATAAANGANSAAPLFVLYMKDGSSYAVSDYWLAGGKLHYVTSYGGENTVDLAQLDVQKTVDVNAAAGRKFSLRAGPAN